MGYGWMSATAEFLNSSNKGTMLTLTPDQVAILRILFARWKDQEFWRIKENGYTYLQAEEILQKDPLYTKVKELLCEK